MIGIKTRHYNFFSPLPLELGVVTFKQDFYGSDEFNLLRNELGYSILVATHEVGYGIITTIGTSPQFEYIKKGNEIPFYKVEGRLDDPNGVAFKVATNEVIPDKEIPQKKKQGAKTAKEAGKNAQNTGSATN